MYHYYIPARPENIVSLVDTGQWSQPFLSGFTPGKFVCCQNIESSVLASDEPYDQTFILKLVVNQTLIPEMPSCSDEKQHVPVAMMLSKIDPASIQKIFVYSEREWHLLINLFQGKCPKPIDIKPELFSSIKSRYSQPSLHTTAQVTAKLSAGDESKHYGSKTSKHKKRQDCHVLERLVTVEEHLRLLKSVLQNVQKNILITSFGVTYETLCYQELYRLIQQVYARGVSVYIYCNDNAKITQKTIDFLSAKGIRYDVAFTHSKLLVMDESLIVIGSFNWLSCIDSRYPESDNASIVYQGYFCKGLKQELWEYLNHYRHRQFGHIKQLVPFLQDLDNNTTSKWSIGNNSTMEYLPTLDQHLGFFQNIFQIAKKQIIICAPFLSPVQNYSREMPIYMVRQVVQRGVQLFFVCANNKNQISNAAVLIDFLKPCRGQNIFVLFIDNFHCKTIVVDNDLIAEGSFNWLSASRDESSEFHNHEATLVVRGDQAQNLIQHFYRSRVGQKIVSLLNTPESKVPLNQQDQYNRNRFYPSHISDRKPDNPVGALSMLKLSNAKG